jgi:hypothetical protein
MEKYRISISSPPDREALVAEIFFSNIQWAEINQNRSVMEVEFYPRPDGQPWRISLEYAQDALESAKQRLLEIGVSGA